MGCNSQGLVLVKSTELAALQAQVASQADTIKDLECKLSQLNGKLKSTQAKRIIKPVKTKCSDAEPNCGC